MKPIRFIKSRVGFSLTGTFDTPPEFPLVFHEYLSDRYVIKKSRVCRYDTPHFTPIQAENQLISYQWLILTAALRPFVSEITMMYTWP